MWSPLMENIIGSKAAKHKYMVNSTFNQSGPQNLKDKIDL